MYIANAQSKRAILRFRRYTPDPSLKRQIRCLKKGALGEGLSKLEL